MQRNYGPWLALILVGCQPSVPTDTVESLAANPERLKEVQRQCKLNRTMIGDATCNAASEAYRQRFMRSRTMGRAPDKSTERRSDAQEQ